MNSNDLKSYDKQIFGALNLLAQGEDNMATACDAVIEWKYKFMWEIEWLKGEIEKKETEIAELKENESRHQNELEKKNDQILKLESEKNQLEGWKNRAETIEKALYSRIPKQLDSEPNAKVILDTAKNAIAGESIPEVVPLAQQLVYIISLCGECGQDTGEDVLKLLGHYLNVFVRKCGYTEDDICTAMRGFAAVYNEQLLAEKFKLEIPALQGPLDNKIAKSRSDATNVMAVYNWAIKDGSGKVLVRADVG